MDSPFEIPLMTILLLWATSCLGPILGLKCRDEGDRDFRAEGILELSPSVSGRRRTDARLVQRGLEGGLVKTERCEGAVRQREDPPGRSRGLQCRQQQVPYGRVDPLSV